jgi:hypothetical protein
MFSKPGNIIRFSTSVGAPFLDGQPEINGLQLLAGKNV